MNGLEGFAAARPTLGAGPSATLFEAIGNIFTSKSEAKTAQKIAEAQTAQAKTQLISDALAAQSSQRTVMAALAIGGAVIVIGLVIWKRRG